MADEIERKFLIKKMPDLSGFEPVAYERYYLYRNSTCELRVQKKGSKYEIERKEMVNPLTAKKTKLTISKGEFERLKKIGGKAILREGFFLSSDPDISIKIYHGRHEGLKKVEVEFKSEEEAKAFKVPDWFGEEITDSIVSRDSKLVDLSDEEFQNFLRNHLA
ncbi:MAG: hypothetical protein JW991_02100 [Candidatus Pacebacteria bacterium]|nr:hypothetical protein [Candidatus Paceibacterota bacterium]